MDAAQHNGAQQHQNEDAADHAQLLADGGEHEVGVLGVEGAGLGADAVVQALAGQTAVAQGVQALLGVPADAQALLVDGGVEDHHDAVLLILAHDVFPDQGPRRADAGQTAQEPPELHAAQVGHDDGDEHVDQSDAGVAAEDQDQAHNERQVEADHGNGPDRGDMLPMDAHGLRQDDDEGDLADLTGLHVDRHARQMDPAALAGGAGDAEGDDEQHEQQVEDKQQIAALGEDVHVDQREQEIEHDAQQQSEGLDEHVTGVAVVVGGAGDDHNAEYRRADAQHQQQQIALAEKISNGRHDPLHGSPPFHHVSYYSSIFCRYCKQKSCFAARERV